MRAATRNRNLRMRIVGWFWICLILPLSVSAQSLDDGVALFNRGKLSEAKSIFESVLKQNEKNAEAHYRMGLVLLSRQYRNEDDAVDHRRRRPDEVAGLEAPVARERPRELGDNALGADRSPVEQERRLAVDLAKAGMPERDGDLG